MLSDAHLQLHSRAYSYSWVSCFNLICLACVYRPSMKSCLKRNRDSCLLHKSATQNIWLNKWATRHCQISKIDAVACWQVWLRIAVYAVLPISCSLFVYQAWFFQYQRCTKRSICFASKLWSSSVHPAFGRLESFFLESAYLFYLYSQFTASVSVLYCNVNFGMRYCLPMYLFVTQGMSMDTAICPFVTAKYHVASMCDYKSTVIVCQRKDWLLQYPPAGGPTLMTILCRTHLVGQQREKKVVAQHVRTFVDRESTIGSALPCCMRMCTHH